MSSNSGENAVSSSRLFASIYMSTRDKTPSGESVKVTYCLKHRQPEVNGVCRVCTHYRERGVNDSHNVEAAKTELPARNIEAERRGKRAMAIILLVAALTVIIILLASALTMKRKKTKKRPAAVAVETTFKV